MKTILLSTLVIFLLSSLGGNVVEIQPADFMYTTSTTFIGHVYKCRPKLNN